MLSEKQQMSLQKNSDYEIAITGMTNEGNGVGRIGDYAVFVPDTAIGDFCRVKLVKKNHTYGFGKLIEVIEPSDDRIVSDCAAFPQCGGCVYRHITYAAECSAKEQLVRDAFLRIGRIDAPVQPIMGSARQTAYRNKAQYPFGLDRKGNMVCGFYARRSHRIVPCDSCALHPLLFEQIKRAVCELVLEKHIPIYNEQNHKGLLRHLYLRIGERTGEVMVCFVVAKRQPEQFAPIAKILVSRFSQIKSVVLNVNTEQTNVILGTECMTICGSDTISDILCGVKIRLSPLSFYQVNRDQAEVLYKAALECASLDSDDTLLDLYCGAGTIGLSAAHRIKRLIGVEIVPEAVENAKRNAAENGIKNAEFFCADAGTAAVRFAEEGIRPNVIVVDPPRKGLDENVIQAIGGMAPEKLVMVSCNPATAARDAARLKAKGYEAKKIIPVDLFPRTAHVETVCLLSKLNARQHIEIDLDMDELDLTGAERKATYEEIKKYVLEHTGLKVSHLNIAQVKQKYGIIERKNYNLPKSESSRQPQCTPEKEKAIKVALKHFKQLNDIE